MAEHIDDIIARGRRISDEAKEVLQRAAATRTQMKAKLARARDFYARCGTLPGTQPHDRRDPGRAH
jgi:hypothetical protein